MTNTYKFFLLSLRTGKLGSSKRTSSTGTTFLYNDLSSNFSDVQLFESHPQETGNREQVFTPSESGRRKGGYNCLMQLKNDPHDDRKGGYNGLMQLKNDPHDDGNRNRYNCLMQHKPRSPERLPDNSSGYNFLGRSGREPSQSYNYPEHQMGYFDTEPMNRNNYFGVLPAYRKPSNEEDAMIRSGVHRQIMNPEPHQNTSPIPFNFDNLDDQNSFRNGCQGMFGLYLFIIGLTYVLFVSKQNAIKTYNLR